jgi:1,4-alpha-glucan branching enzyme
MIRKKPLGNGQVAVTFEMPSSIWADSIYLVGDFNDWNKQAHPLKQRHSDGAWDITLTLEAGKTYRFRYLINQTDWQNDWQADGYVPNPYGSEDSIVVP